MRRSECGIRSLLISQTSARSLQPLLPLWTEKQRISLIWCLASMCSLPRHRHARNPPCAASNRLGGSTACMLERAFTKAPWRCSVGDDVAVEEIAGLTALAEATLDDILGSTLDGSGVIDPRIALIE